MSGFWAGGCDAYHSYLYKEYLARYRQLEKEFSAAATSIDQQRICQEIEDLNTDYEQKLHDHLLF